MLTKHDKTGNKQKRDTYVDIGIKRIINERANSLLKKDQTNSSLERVDKRQCSEVVEAKIHKNLE